MPGIFCAPVPGIQRLHQRHNDGNHWDYVHNRYNQHNCIYRNNRNNRDHGNHCDYSHDWNHHEHDIDDQHNWKSDHAQ